jgi:hypothetical protein
MSEHHQVSGTSGFGSVHPKLDPDSDPDPERSADREAVALAMVTDLNKVIGVAPVPQQGSAEDERCLPQKDQTSQPRKKQRKRPREDEKICRVCGDKALAHNFDAITCESCKAFFRRNALRQEVGTFYDGPFFIFLLRVKSRLLWLFCNTLGGMVQF